MDFRIASFFIVDYDSGDRSPVSWIMARQRRSVTGKEVSALANGSGSGQDRVSPVTLGCHGGSRPSEPADAFPDSSSRARMRSSSFAHPVWDNHGSNQFLHSNASVFRHLS